MTHLHIGMIYMYCWRSTSGKLCVCRSLGERQYWCTYLWIFQK